MGHCFGKWEEFVGDMTIVPIAIGLASPEQTGTSSRYFVSIGDDRGGLGGDYLVRVLDHSDKPNDDLEVVEVRRLEQQSSEPSLGGIKRFQVMQTLVLSYWRLRRIAAEAVGS